MSDPPVTAADQTANGQTADGQLVGDPAVELDGVDVRIDGRTVLEGVDWTVLPSQRWVVMGPNGSGKTTLTRVITMAMHPSRGQVSVLGSSLGTVDVRRHRRQIGVVSSSVANLLRDEITALDAVMSAINGALEVWWHTYSDHDRHQALAWLERFGVGGLARQTFGTLSSGERQRVLLARALITEPRLVVLDEPMAGLDLGGRESLLADLTTLATDTATVPLVLVTHHLEEIPRGFTHALLLRAGRVVAAGAIEETLTNEALSECFGLSVEVAEADGRWWARSEPTGR